MARNAPRYTIQTPTPRRIFHASIRLTAGSIAKLMNTDINTTIKKDRIARTAPVPI